MEDGNMVISFALKTFRWDVYTEPMTATIGMYFRHNDEYRSWLTISTSEEAALTPLEMVRLAKVIAGERNECFDLITVEVTDYDHRPVAYGADDNVSGDVAHISKFATSKTHLEKEGPNWLMETIKEFYRDTERYENEQQ